MGQPFAAHGSCTFCPEVSPQHLGHCVGPSPPPGPAAQGGVLSIRVGSGVGGVHSEPPL